MIKKLLAILMCCMFLIIPSNTLSADFEFSFNDLRKELVIIEKSLEDDMVLVDHISWSKSEVVQSYVNVYDYLYNDKTIDDVLNTVNYQFSIYRYKYQYKGLYWLKHLSFDHMTGNISVSFVVVDMLNHVEI